MDVSNQDEAEKCRDLAKGFYSKGQYTKAIKFYQKSLQLHPLPGTLYPCFYAPYIINILFQSGVQALLEKAIKKLEEESSKGNTNKYFFTLFLLYSLSIFRNILL